MVYNLNNQQEAANIIVQIQTDATEGQLKVSDFQWFITEIKKAIDKKSNVDLRYDLEEQKKGVIKSAKIEYDSTNTKSSKLTIEFNEKTTNQTLLLTYNFDAELVEENTNSMPGSFMKYYIKDNNNNVIVTVIIYYN